MALSFDNATNDHPYIDTNLPDVSGAFTISLWVKNDVDTDAYANVFTLRNSRKSGILFGANGTSIELGSDYDESSTYALDSNWHNVIWVSNAYNDNDLWIDGVKRVDAFSFVADLSTSFTEIILGGFGNGTSYDFNGDIAYVKFWTVALSDSELALEVNESEPQKTSDLYGYWELSGANLTEAYNDDSVNSNHWLTPSGVDPTNPTIVAGPNIPSASLSPSASPSASISPSISPSASISPSTSPSASGGAPIEGSTVWGHDTGVLETNVRDFTGNWTGTGTVENTGDAERIAFEVGDVMTSEIVFSDTLTIELLQNVYSAGDTVSLEYRHASTEGGIAGAGWNTYTVKFMSLGYVQVRLSRVA